MQVAIEQALTILAWFENNSKDDVPPEHLWEDPEGLELWWERVRDRRERGVTGRPDDDSTDEDLAENELARAFKE